MDTQVLLVSRVSASSFGMCFFAVVFCIASLLSVNASILQLGFPLHGFLQLPFEVFRIIGLAKAQSANSFWKNMCHTDILAQQGCQFQLGQLVDRFLRAE